MYFDSYVYPNANYGYEVIQRVPNVDAVSACRVPLDGRVSYFVLNDNSAIRIPALLQALFTKRQRRLVL